MSFTTATIVFPILFAFVAYLLGSINFAILITKKYTGEDIRSKGSQNAGMTNVMRTVGAKAGVITLIGDAIKAFVAVVLGKYLMPLVINCFIADGMTVSDMISNGEYSFFATPVFGAYLCGFFVVLGHILPLFFKFKGGKGIVTIISAILIINWKIFLALLIFWLIIFLISKIISLASVLSAVIYPFITFFTCRFLSDPSLKEFEGMKTFFGLDFIWFETIMSTIFALIIIYKHRSNIQRLLKGEEKRLTVNRSNKK